MVASVPRSLQQLEEAFWADIVSTVHRDTQQDRCELVELLCDDTTYCRRKRIHELLQGHEYIRVTARQDITMRDLIDAINAQPVPVTTLLSLEQLDEAFDDALCSDILICETAGMECVSRSLRELRISEMTDQQRDRYRAVRRGFAYLQLTPRAEMCRDDLERAMQ